MATRWNKYNLLRLFLLGLRIYISYTMAVLMLILLVLLNAGVIDKPAAIGHNDLPTIISLCCFYLPILWVLYRGDNKKRIKFFSLSILFCLLYIAGRAPFTLNIPTDEVIDFSPSYFSIVVAVILSLSLLYFVTRLEWLKAIVSYLPPICAGFIFGVAVRPSSWFFYGEYIKYDITYATPLFFSLLFEALATMHIELGIIIVSYLLCSDLALKGLKQVVATVKDKRLSQRLVDKP